MQGDLMSTRGNVASATNQSSQQQMSGEKANAEKLLKADHRKVQQLYKHIEKKEDENQNSQIVKQICTELIIHTKLEEELFYPACREKQVEDDLLDEAQVEHDGAKIMISELIAASPGDEFYDAKVKVLSE